MQKLLFAVSVGALAPIALAQSSCFAPPGSTLVADATSIGDTIYPAVPIGFPFPLNGQTYTDIHLSDHIFAFLSNGGVPTVPAGGAITYNVFTSDFIGNGPCISPFWSDSTMGNIGTLTVESSATEFIATWTDVATFFAVPPEFSVQMRLYPSGEVRFLYNATTNNYGSTFAPNAIVGITPGVPSVLPASSDLSAGVTTVDPTVFEEFVTASTFDLADNGIQFLPTNPGWVVVQLGAPTGCASAQAYGIGCNDAFASFYEVLTAASMDLSGTAITMLSTGGGGYVTQVGPGTVLPTGSIGTATVVPLGDDNALPAGTLGLEIGSNCWVATGPGNNVGFVPDVPTFLSNPSTAFYAWTDLQPNAAGSGQVFYEESGSQALITFDNVYGWGTTAGNTVQFLINTATGDCTITFGALSPTNPEDWLVGYSPGGANLDPGAEDISAITALQLFATDTAPLTLAGTAPAFGSNWTLTTTNIDTVSPISITFFGDGQIPLPGGLPLQSIGIDAPGCFVWINTVLGTLTGPNVGGSAQVSLAIPTNASFAGSILTAQSICLTLDNPAALKSSNGFEGVIGN